MMAFSEHRKWIISVFDRRSIMNRLYWHNQQVGYLCFIPFVWEQSGVIATVAGQTAMISHLLPMCWATRGWFKGMWARFGSQGSIALNWHSRYYVARVIVALDCNMQINVNENCCMSSRCILNQGRSPPLGPDQSWCHVYPPPFPHPGPHQSWYHVYPHPTPHPGPHQSWYHVYPHPSPTLGLTSFDTMYIGDDEAYMINSFYLQLPVDCLK